MAIPPGQETSHPSAAEIREYLLSELNESLRRPGMYGGELALHLYLDAVAFAHGLPHFMRDEIASLQRAQVFLSTGVRGGFEVF